MIDVYKRQVIIRHSFCCGWRFRRRKWLNLGTGQKLVVADHNLSDVDGGKRVHVLVGRDRLDDRLLVEVEGLHAVQHDRFAEPFGPVELFAENPELGLPADRAGICLLYTSRCV